MVYQGIIFDFNGVLIWDTPLQEEAWKTYSKNKRGYSFSDEEMKLHVHGRNNRHTLSYLMDEKLSDKVVHRLTQEKETIYRQLCLDLGDSFKLSPGSVDLLNWLKKNKIPRTIATASEWSNLSFFIKHLNLGNWFNLDQIVYDDGTLHGKPHRDIYMTAADSINLEPYQCLVVEDSISGIQSAFEAEIGYIVALGDHSQLSKMPGVKMVIESMEELPLTLFFTKSC